MDYQVGSLADMISATHSKTESRKLKEAEGGVKIQFQKVEDTPVLSRPTSNKKGSKKRKSDVGMNSTSNKKVKKINDSSEGSPSVATATKKTLSTGAKKRLELKGLPKLPKTQKKEVNIRSELDPEREKRTVFIGNLCLTTSKIQLQKLCRKFGPVEAVRKRGAPVADPRTPKKVAIIKGEFHPDRTSCNAYVRFTTVEDAQKSLALNGTTYKNHILRVDMVDGSKAKDARATKKAVFIGNIKFTLEEDDLRKVFESCGKIESIRLVRDTKTGMGKGFGFVNFESTQSVELALKLDGEEVEKRPIRVTRCEGIGAPKKKLREKKKDKVKKPKQKFEKRTNGDETVVVKRKPAPDRSEFKGQEIVGQKIKKNKKQKPNKGEEKKKVMLNKLQINPKKKKAIKKSKNQKIATP